MAEEVLVIGAGPSGIAAAYYLQKAHINYKVVDKANEIASTWNSLYPSLSLNTTRYFSHMPETPFPRSYGIYPTGKQYHTYLEKFVEKHQFNIHLNVEVFDVKPQDNGYLVTSSEGVEWYPNIIIATGRFNHPYTAPLPQLTNFQGKVIHAHDYKRVKPFLDQRVLVIGNGPSGLDISIDIGQHNAPAKPALLSMRTGIKLRRRYPFGLTKHGWILIAEQLPKDWGIKLVDYISEYSFPEEVRNKIRAPTSEQFSTAAGTRGPELIDAVNQGQVICVGNPLASEPERIQVEELDGTHKWYDIDAIIIATGYKSVLGFLNDEIVYETDREDWPLRYSSQNYSKPAHITYGLHGVWDEEKQLTAREIRDYPGLFITGTFYQGKGAMHNFNVDGELIASQIQQRRQDSAKAPIKSANISEV